MSKAIKRINTIFAGLIAVLLVPAGTARTTTSETAESLCVREMEINQKALAIRDLKVRRHDDVPYVYGNADFDDIKNLHFRCKVRRDALQDVRYLVKDPEYVDGRMWVSDRPQGNAHENFVLDEPAMSAPPPVSSGPHFIRPPKSE